MPQTRRPMPARTPTPAPPAVKRRPWLWILAAALLVTAGAFAWPLVSAWTEREVVRQARQAVDEADERELPSLMRQLGQCEAAGWGELAALLAHPRPEIREQATAEIAAILEQSRTAPAAIASQRVARLARLMAETNPKVLLSPDIVDPLFTWPVDSKSIDASQFFADCQRLMERVSPRVARLHEPVKRPRQVSTEEPAPPEASFVPGEKLAPVVTPRAPISATIPLESDPVDAPNPLGELQSPGQLDPEQPSSETGRARPIPQKETPQRLIQPAPARPLSKWEARSDLEVMQELHAAEQSDVQAAVVELRRRGYQTHHLALARSLTHPDPAVRRDLVEALPRVPDVEWRRWVTPLLDDEDGGVRMAAEAVLRAGESTRRLR